MLKQGKGRGRGRARAANQNPTVGNQNPVVGNQNVAVGDQHCQELGAVLNEEFSNLSLGAHAESRGRGRRAHTSPPPQAEDAFSYTSSSPDSQYASMSDNGTPPPSPPAINRTIVQRPLLERPGYGTRGRPINLEVNYFRMKCRTGIVYHYDIQINSLDMIKKYGKNHLPKKQTAREATLAGKSLMEQELDRSVGKIKAREVFECLVKSKALKEFNPVYDGVKSIFTSSRLPFESKQVFKVPLVIAGKTRQYEVEIKPVKKEDGTNEINLNAMNNLNETSDYSEALMAFNTIMNHRDLSSNQVQVGRAFFFLHQPNKVALGEGLEIWFGYNQSVHMTENGPSLILNLAAKAFHQSGSIIKYVSDILRRDITRDRNSMKPYEIRKCEEALKGVKVCATHQPYKRKYTIQGISKLSAQDLKTSVDGKMQSIAEYFSNKYRRLQFPHLHCLHMRSNTNQTYIPFENCEVLEGQPKQGKLSGPLTAKMIKSTAIVPNARFASIMNSSKDVCNQSGDKMQSFNLMMEMRPIHLGGRVLPPPDLVYLNSKPSRPDKRGVWGMEGKNFFKASAESQSWLILSFINERNCPGRALEEFADSLSNTGRKLGLNFGKLLDIRILRPNDSSEEALYSAAKTGASFCVIVLSKKDVHRSYDEIKFIADYKLGLVTQCIEESVLNRFNGQIACNVCLKINTKLGGVNHVLMSKPMIFKKPVIVFGADVIHAPRGSGCPSIAAVVGSLDAHPSKYKVACRVQENPDMSKISQELILDVRGMAVTILKAFYHNTRGHNPEKVIFFRDGVSEGQFEKVRDYEVSELQKACEEQIGKVVPITFIVVQKRHQTRIRPTNPADGVGKGLNVPPGTTLDRGITHPKRFDYFLNSHEGIQGTSKPAHYTVLHDDNKFSADEIQELSYHLCYTYVKCNRSISIPPPVMYADLACYRAKKYADFHLQRERESCSSYSDSSVKLPEFAKVAIESMGEFKASMFYV